MSKVGDIVRVDWIDSMATPGWGEFNKPDLKCVSAGILFEQDKDSLTIIQNRSAYQDGEYMTIPRRAIKRVKTLERPRSKR